MKRLLLIIVIIMLTFSCTTKGPIKEKAIFLESEEVIERWISAVKNGNLDLVSDLYWDNAVLVIHSPERGPLEFAGRDRIVRQFKKSILGILNPDRVIADRIERIMDSPDSHPVYTVHFENSPNIQFLMLSNRGGVWRIQEHTVENKGRSPGVAGKYQEWADFNRNGQLEPEEFEELINAVRHLLTEPHDNATPLDELFDYNHDSFIDPGELERARQEYFGFLIRRFGEEAPDAARELFDLNGDGRSEPDEKRLALQIIFNSDEIKVMERLPDEVKRLYDRNRDGRVEEFEVRETRLKLLEILALAPLEERSMMGIPRRVANYLDELADLNNNGTVDEEENMMLMRGLKEPHSVENPFDKRLDTNYNGEVEPFEIIRARRAGNLEGGVDQLEMRDNYPVITIVDRALDIDGNDKVDSDEISTVIKMLIEGPAEDGYPERLFTLFDINRDNRISLNELREGRILLINPHPVDPDRALDQKLDEDRDGFVAPHEIGIAAGVSPAGPALPFEELIERFRWESKESELKDGPLKKETEDEFVVFEEEIVKRLESMEDKKLAVVGLNNQIDTLSKQTIAGLVVFVENALVNVGKVKVVDRQNIAKIMEEQKFQLSGITDESTAVEIGKLAGADIIVIGSMSYVGSMYYINIKLIGVETAQILGSSISQASEDIGFLNMCNDAVYKLFLE